MQRNEGIINNKQAMWTIQSQKNQLSCKIYITILQMYIIIQEYLQIMGWKIDNTL